MNFTLNASSIVGNNPITCQGFIDKAFNDGMRYNDIISRNQVLSLSVVFLITVILIFILEKNRKIIKKGNADIDKLEIQNNYLLSFLYFQMIFILFFIISNLLL